jgi:hypothetical protein
MTYFILVANRERYIAGSLNRSTEEQHIYRYAYYFVCSQKGSGINHRSHIHVVASIKCGYWQTLKIFRREILIRVLHKFNHSKHLNFLQFPLIYRKSFKTHFTFNIVRQRSKFTVLGRHWLSYIVKHEIKGKSC